MASATPRAGILARACARRRPSASPLAGAGIDRTSTILPFLYPPACRFRAERPAAGRCSFSTTSCVQDIRVLPSSPASYAGLSDEPGVTQEEREAIAQFIADLYTTSESTTDVGTYESKGEDSLPGVGKGRTKARNEYVVDSDFIAPGAPVDVGPSQRHLDLLRFQSIPDNGHWRTKDTKAILYASEGIIARIESQLRHTKTDREAWVVLEQEVFQIARKLNAALEFDGMGQTLVENEHGNEAQAGAEDTIPEAVILATVYPVCLLMALRIIHRGFCNPTLALSILPTIRAHQGLSYLLGATIALLNEHITILWKEYFDFSQIGELLLQMEREGIQPDSGTLDILKSLRKERKTAMRLARKETGTPTWAYLFQIERLNSGYERLSAARKILTSHLEKAG